MLRRMTAYAVLAVVIAVVFYSGSCGSCGRPRTPPIVVEDRAVKIQNQTGEPWTDVQVWLNDHYLATTPTLAPGGRFTARQRDFIAGMGQKFDPARQTPYGVVITAKSAGGRVRIVWGHPYNRR